MKRFLAIETSGEACSVALSVAGEVIQRHQHAPLRHAELLLPAVHELLAEGGLALRQLDAIVFGRGPGSFTSLRIGIGVVQGLAWGAELPVVPVSSLAAVAQQAAAMGAAHVLVAVDARMGEVFHCSYAVDAAKLPRALRTEQVCPPAEVALDLPGGFTAAGNGFARYAELAALAEVAADAVQLRPDIEPRATALLPLAIDWLTTHEPLPAAEAQPFYVRNHVADKTSER